jgi:hypothetical protein
MAPKFKAVVQDSANGPFVAGTRGGGVLDYEVAQAALAACGYDPATGRLNGDLDVFEAEMRARGFRVKPGALTLVIRAARGE